MSFVGVMFGACLVLTTFSYCSRENPQQVAERQRQEQLKQQKEAAEAEKARLQREAAVGLYVKGVEMTVHSCDNNAGMKEISFYNNNLLVVCNNTVSTDFNKVYESISKQ